MALRFHSIFPLTDHQPYRHLPNLRKLNSAVRAQNPSTDSANEPAPAAKKPAAGQGFGSPPPQPSDSSKSGAGGGKRKQKGKRERAAIIRRTPVGKPAFVSEEVGDKDAEQGTNERAFVLAWLGLGGVILGQGIILSASGFLPEEWDRFFVKYLFPIFTPTVGLFLAGTVTYGVVKYLQNEKLKGQK